MGILKMQDVDLRGQRVLIRVDFNVPIKNGQITSEKRLFASLPTLQLAVNQGAKVMVMSHLGQPKEGEFDENFSLKPVAAWLSNQFGKTIRLEKDWLDGVAVENGELVLLENVRFNVGEKKNDETLAKKMANLCDIFVMDAFATAHRAQASTYGVAQFAKIAVAGPLLTQEIEALSKALEMPRKPLMAITCGAKVSTKLQLLENFLTKVNFLLLGGGIANTFLLAQGYNIGKSLCEVDFVGKAKELLATAQKLNVSIPLPIDVVVAKEISETAKGVIKLVTEISDDDIILDIGPQTIENLVAMVKRANTIIWNGPLGMFELDEFSNGTKAIANAIAQAEAFTLAGGGDTVAAIEKFKLATNRFSYVSTAGGAFLEYLQGLELPAVKVLKMRGENII